MRIEQFIREAFSLPPTLIEYHVSQRLKQLFPQKACIEVEAGYFNVESYANAQQCHLTQNIFLHNQMMTYWLEPGPEVMHHGGPAGHPHRIRQHGEQVKPGQETMAKSCSCHR